MIAWGLSTMASALLPYKKAESEYKKEVERKARTAEEAQQLQDMHNHYYDAFLGFISQYMFPAFAEVKREMFMRKQQGINVEHHKTQEENFYSDCIAILSACARCCTTEDITRCIANEQVEQLVMHQLEA